MRLLNVRINFFYLLRTFCPHLGSFCVVSSFTTFRPNFPSGLLQVIYRDLGYGMLSLVTVSPVITAFHSCCLLHNAKKTITKKKILILTLHIILHLVHHKPTNWFNDNQHCYIYIYIYIEEFIFRSRVVFKASFIKDNGTLFVYNF